MDDRRSPIYGTTGYQAPEIARTGPTVAVGPVHRGPHARGAVHRLPRLPGHVPVHAPAAARRAALRPSTTRCTASSSGRRPPIPTTASRPPTRWRPSSFGVLREVVGDQHRHADPGAEHAASPARRDGAARHGRLAHPARPARRAPTTPAPAVVVTLGAMEPEAVARGASGRCPTASVEIDLRRVRALIDARPARRGEPPCSTGWRLRWPTRPVAGLARAWYRGAGGPGRGATATRASRASRSCTGTCPASWRPSWRWPTPPRRPATTTAAAAWYDIVSRHRPRLHVGGVRAGPRPPGRWATGRGAVEALRADPGHVERPRGGPDRGGRPPARRRRRRRRIWPTCVGRRRSSTGSALERRAAGPPHAPPSSRRRFGALQPQRHRRRSRRRRSSGTRCTDRDLRLGLEPTYRAARPPRRHDAPSASPSSTAPTASGRGRGGERRRLAPVAARRAAAGVSPTTSSARRCGAAIAAGRDAPAHHVELDLGCGGRRSPTEGLVHQRNDDALPRRGRTASRRCSWCATGCPRRPAPQVAAQVAAEAAGRSHERRARARRELDRTGDRAGSCRRDRRGGRAPSSRVPWRSVGAGTRRRARSSPAVVGRRRRSPSAGPATAARTGSPPTAAASSRSTTRGPRSRSAPDG